MGNDTLIGGAGIDQAYGGFGNDTFVFASTDGAGAMDGGADTDTLTITAAGVADTLTVTLSGSSLTTLDFGAALNTLLSLEAITANLGGGIDTLAYATASTGATANLATGTASGFTSIALIENLAGGNGDDDLTGNAAANSLSGGAGADSLYGGIGADTLFGGAGADLLTGGLSADRFCFAALSDMGLGLGNRDVITDFSSGDRLDFSRIDANATLAGDQAFTLTSGIGTGGFTANAQVRYSFVDTDADGLADSTLIQINFDGSLAADYDLLVLNRTVAMAAFDFTL